MKFLLMGVILIGLALIVRSETGAADWKYFGAGGDGVFWWYDAQGVFNQPGKIIQVWVKKIKINEAREIFEGGRKVTVSELEQMALGRGYERSLMEIDCGKKTLTHLQKLDYDSKGTLKGGESKLGTRKIIPSETVAERLYEVMCK